MTSLQAHQVKRAVVALCPEVAGDNNPAGDLLDRNDRTLWRQFMNCLLSSQVPYELACSAAQEIDEAGVLADAPLETTIADVHAILSRPLCVEGRWRRYRFHSTKAVQLARSWDAVRSAGGLAFLVEGFESDHAARGWFIRNAPGLGPKQASMFLRDIGYSHDLAVLDRHTLDYMVLAGLCPAGPRYVSSLKRYLELEEGLREHARSVGHSLGHLDRAIWLVMRVWTRETRGGCA